MNVVAYLDPASGSLIAATAAAGLAGVGVAAKSMWRKQTDRFRKSDDSEQHEEPEEFTTDQETLSTVPDRGSDI